MRIVILFVIGLLLGAASWRVSYAVSGAFEPFDSATGFFVCQTVLALPALAIGMRAGILRALLMLAGAWAGMNAYVYTFGDSGSRAWIALLLFTSLTLLVFPAIAGMLGGILRAILRKSRDTTGTAPP
jgi:hypothetical protein